MSRLARILDLSTDVVASNPDDQDPVLRQLDLTTELMQEAERHRHDLVQTARLQGYSWSKIGGAMGMTKQSAQERYGKKPTGPAPDAEQLRLGE